MLSILILIAGLALAAAVSFVLAIALEMALSVGELHAALGGFGAFIWCPIAVVVALIASVIGLAVGATGWALFLYPLWGCLAAFAVFAMLGFIGKLTSR